MLLDLRFVPNAKSFANVAVDDDANAANELEVRVVQLVDDDSVLDIKKDVVLSFSPKILKVDIYRILTISMSKVSVVNVNLLNVFGRWQIEIGSNWCRGKSLWFGWWQN